MSGRMGYSCDNSKVETKALTLVNIDPYYHTFGLTRFSKRAAHDMLIKC